MSHPLYEQQCERISEDVTVGRVVWVIPETLRYKENTETQGKYSDARENSDARETLKH